MKFTEAELERLLAAPLLPATRHPGGLTVHLAAGPGLLTGPEYHLSFRRGVTKKNRKWKESTGVWVDAQPRVLAAVGVDAATRFVHSNRVVREALREGVRGDRDSQAAPAGASTGAGSSMVAMCLYGAFRDDGRVERFWPYIRERLYASAWNKATRGAEVPNASRLSRLDEHPLRFLEPDLFVSTWDFVVEGASRKDAREYGENRSVWRGRPLDAADAVRRVKGVYGAAAPGNGDWLRGWHVADHARVGTKTKCQRMWCVVPLVKAMCLLAATEHAATSSDRRGARASRLGGYRYLLVHRMDRVPEHPFTVRGPSCFGKHTDPLAERRDFSGSDDPRNDTDVDRPLVAGCFLHMGECATFYGYRLFYPDAPIMRGRAIVHLPVSKFDRYDRWTWVSDFTVFGFVDEVARQLLGTIAFVAEALERDPAISSMRVSAELVNGQGFEVAGIQPLGLNMEFGDVRARARHSSRITTSSCGKSMPGRLVAVCGNHEMRTHKQVGSADCGKRKQASPVDFA
jgi:hypothetical protein